jgi:hypothetical protein
MASKVDNWCGFFAGFKSACGTVATLETGNHFPGAISTSPFLETFTMPDSAQPVTCDINTNKAKTGSIFDMLEISSQEIKRTDEVLLWAETEARLANLYFVPK